MDSAKEIERLRVHIASLDDAIRGMTDARPEESTADAVRRVVAERDEAQLRLSRVRSIVGDTR